MNKITMTKAVKTMENGNTTEQKSLDGFKTPVALDEFRKQKKQKGNAAPDYRWLAQAMGEYILVFSGVILQPENIPIIRPPNALIANPGMPDVVFLNKLSSAEIVKVISFWLQNSIIPRYCSPLEASTEALRATAMFNSTAPVRKNEKPA